MANTNFIVVDLTLLAFYSLSLARKYVMLYLQIFNTAHTAQENKKGKKRLKNYEHIKFTKDAAAKLITFESGSINNIFVVKIGQNSISLRHLPKDLKMVS